MVRVKDLHMISKHVQMTYMSALKVILIILLTIIIISPTKGNAASITGSTTISVLIDSTQSVGEYTFPWPFSDYKLIVKIRIITNPVFSIKYSSDKDLISTGENVTLLLNTSPTNMELKSWILLWLLKGHEEIHTLNIEFQKFSIEFPGSYKTPSISIPALPLHEFGIPLTIGLSLRVEISTEVPLVIRAERLNPSTYSGVITKDLLSLRYSFMKINGIGARLILDRVGLKFEGKLYVGLTIIELPSKYEFPPLSLFTLSAESMVSRELVKLKTPLNVFISTTKKCTILGDTLIFTGKISPPVAGIKIDLMARKIDDYWFTVASVFTDSNGSFTVNWSPTEAGEYEIRAYHAGEEYSTEVWSNIIKVRTVEATPPIDMSWIVVMCIVVMIVVVALVAWRLRTRTGQ